MRQKDLRVIQEHLRATRNTIEILSEKDELGLISNRDLREMYFRINEESIKITEIIKNLPWEE